MHFNLIILEGRVFFFKITASGTMPFYYEGDFWLVFILGRHNIINSSPTVSVEFKT